MSPEPESGAGRGRDQEAAPSLAEIRAELRRRGYLDSPLDRFLLRDRLRHRLSRLGAAAAVAARTGLLGGPLVGLPVAAAASGLAGGRGGAGSLALLAVVLSVTFGLLLALLEGATALVLSRVRGSRASRLATRAGILLAGLGTVYLALWWRVRRESLGGAGWLDLLSVALIALLAFSLARLTGAAGSALVAAAAAARRQPAPPRPRRPGALLGLLLAAALTGVLLFAGRQPATPPGLVAAPRVAPAGRLLVVGLDGLGPDTLAEARAAGLVPTLSGLLDGAAVRRLKRPTPMDPPAVWTTYATGLWPAGHGVDGVEWRSLAGVPAPARAGPLLAALVDAADALLPVPGRLSRSRPVSAWVRRAPAVWEILGGQGVPVVAAHWWATSPAVAVPGCLISDRAYARLEAGGVPAGEMWPPHLARTARRRHAVWLAETSGRLPEGSGDGALRRALLADLFAADGWLECLAVGEPQAGFLYLWSVDIAHGGDPTRAGGVLAAAGRVAAALRFVDRQVARVAAVRRPDDRLVLLLDPGRQGGDTGLLALVGPGAPRGEAPGGISALQVAPTLLWLTGLPVSSRMDAGPLEGILAPAAASLLPRRPPVDYGPPPRPVPEGVSRNDHQDREYLRSLGYIE